MPPPPIPKGTGGKKKAAAAGSPTEASKRKKKKEKAKKEASPLTEGVALLKQGAAADKAAKADGLTSVQRKQMLREAK